MLVRGEAMVCAGLDEDGAPFPDANLFALDLEHARPLQDDVDLVVLVRLLPVRLGRDEHVDADLEPGRRVDDLVSPSALAEALLAGTAAAEWPFRSTRSGRSTTPAGSFIWTACEACCSPSAASTPLARC